jgi:hypothetical protein
LGILLFGYDQGVMGGLIRNGYFVEYFGSNDWITATIVALFEVGALGKWGARVVWWFGNVSWY